MRPLRCSRVPYTAPLLALERREARVVVDVASPAGLDVDDDLPELLEDVVLRAELAVEPVVDGVAAVRGDAALGLVDAAVRGAGRDAALVGEHLALDARGDGRRLPLPGQRAVREERERVPQALEVRRLARQLGVGVNERRLNVARNRGAERRLHRPPRPAIGACNASAAGVGTRNIECENGEC